MGAHFRAPYYYISFDALLLLMGSSKPVMVIELLGTQSDSVVFPSSCLKYYLTKDGSAHVL